mmetsp:Transcript_34561/g.78145  ORF Transcript_34561/g.78145 Transcript_34561/m.78145 type:complete len:526 (-) Transcript_34561:139-1716(-)
MDWPASKLIELTRKKNDHDKPQRFQDGDAAAGDAGIDGIRESLLDARNFLVDISECLKFKIANPSCRGLDSLVTRKSTMTQTSAMEFASESGVGDSVVTVSNACHSWLQTPPAKKQKKAQVKTFRRKLTLRSLEPLEEADAAWEVQVTSVGPLVGPSVALAATSLVCGQAPDLQPSPTPQVFSFGGTPPTGPSGAFFDFIRERERVRERKDRGEDMPWTQDVILKAHKFTNVKREDDATTRWMRTHWTGPNAEGAGVGEVIFNCALFRYFGTPELAERVGWVKGEWRPREMARAALELRAAGKHCFTRAYCKPHYNSETNDPRKAYASYTKVAKYLTSLWSARHELTRIAQETRSWRRLIDELRGGKSKISGFGGTGFMAKEVMLDALSTPQLSSLIEDRDEWCPCGPGARRGLNRLFDRPTDFCIWDARVEAPFVGELQVLLQAARRELGEEWCARVDLEVHDIQFCLCEWDKYERVRRGERGSVTRHIRGDQRDGQRADQRGRQRGCPGDARGHARGRGRSRR